VPRLSYEGENLRILVVEDDPAVRRALERLFQSAGYHAEFAISLEEGFAKLNGHHVVLLDLQLPDGLGTTLLQKIRRQPRPIRVAIYSGMTDASAVVKACGETPDAIFQKPIDFNDVLAWIIEVTGSIPPSGYREK
jgi:DNA-binding response OmpR family regulator